MEWEEALNLPPWLLCYTVRNKVCKGMGMVETGVSVCLTHPKFPSRKATTSWRSGFLCARRLLSPCTVITTLTKKCIDLDHHPLHKSLHKHTQGLTDCLTENSEWILDADWTSLSPFFLHPNQSAKHHEISSSPTSLQWNLTSTQQGTCLLSLDLTSTAGNTTFTARTKHIAA